MPVSSVIQGTASFFSVIMGEKSKEIIQKAECTPWPFSTLINMPSETLCVKNFYSAFCLTVSQIFHPHLLPALLAVSGAAFPPRSPSVLGQWLTFEN